LTLSGRPLFSSLCTNEDFVTFESPLRILHHDQTPFVTMSPSASCLVSFDEDVVYIHRTTATWRIRPGTFRRSTRGNPSSEHPPFALVRCQRGANDLFRLFHSYYDSNIGPSSIDGFRWKSRNRSASVWAWRGPTDRTSTRCSYSCFRDIPGRGLLAKPSAIALNPWSVP
jgi:hypothetical protein